MRRYALQSGLTIGTLVVCLTCGGRSAFFNDLPSSPEGAFCGNDRLEPGEDCDNANLAGWTCDHLGYVSGTLACTPACRFDESACVAPPGCGDGVQGPGEACDGADLGGQSCLSLGYAGGDLACTAACRFDIRGCRTTYGCGNGTLDPGETCDDGNTAPCDGCSADCLVEQCGNGILDCGELCDDGNQDPGDGCLPSCLPENYCGNGLREPGAGEQCDGGDLGGQTCVALCYEGGALLCRTDCTLDTSQCLGSGAVCGDGHAECGEACDGGDLQGETCESRGWASGTLACTPGCDYDESGCEDRRWYFYEDFEAPAEVQALWTFSGDWMLGTPVGIGQDPNAPFEGIYCIGTQPGGNYSNNQTYQGNRAVTPPIDLTGASQPWLTFQGWLASEPCCDGVNLWLKPQGSSQWVVLGSPQPGYNTFLFGEPAWSGPHFSSWTEVRVNLTAWAGQTVQIAFALASNESLTFSGAYVDRVVVAEP